MTSVRDLPAWLRTTARRPAVPILVTAAALGVVIWALTSTGDSGTTGSSRLEVGGDYTLGLVWKPAQCGVDIRIPARWAIIGSGSILPADDGTIGLGEFEGVENTSKQDPVGPAVAEQFQGEGLADLADALTETEPTEEVEFLLEQELCSSR